MKAWKFGLLLGLLCTGCTHTQLARQTLKQETTLTDLQYQQVLDNLAMFSCNAGALPYFAQTSTGTAQLADQGQGMLGLGWMEGGVNSQMLNLQASRQLTESWNLSPVLDPDKLYRMRCAYQVVIAAAGTDCDKCCERLFEILGSDILKSETRACVLPQGWFGVGCKKDVPKCACHVGHYCNTYVWVLPDGMDGLTRFTLTILNLATANPPTVAVKTIYAPPADAKDAKYGKPTAIEVTSADEINTAPVPCIMDGGDAAARALSARALTTPVQTKVPVTRDIPRPASGTLLSPIR
jgi:hypothetical protein